MSIIATLAAGSIVTLCGEHVRKDYVLDVPVAFSHVRLDDGGLVALSSVNDSVNAALSALPAPLSKGMTLCVTGTAPEAWAFGVISRVSSFTIDGLPSGISVGN